VHRGVHDFISWLERHPELGGMCESSPASASEIAAVEERIASPLPADLRFLLSCYNGGNLPSGQLLSTGEDGPESMLALAEELAQRFSKPVADPDLLFPFYRSDDGGVLAFDRSAGPVADTWPIIDYYLESGEQRLVHRTFDGFCRMRVAEWSSPEFGGEFTLTSYLQSGQRHVSIEPDVSIAHATVAHALRRTGDPEGALQAYLAAARCVPAQPWCDWEALKLSALLGDGRAAWECCVRLSARAPLARWRQRETTPAHVVDVLAVVAPRVTARRERVLRLCDQLREQAQTEREQQHIIVVRQALQREQHPPAALRTRAAGSARPEPPPANLKMLRDAYRAGTIRDEDLLLEPRYASLRRDFVLAQVVREPRAFS